MPLLLSVKDESFYLFQLCLENKWTNIIKSLLTDWEVVLNPVRYLLN